MTTEALNHIRNFMKQLGIPYCLNKWTKNEIPDRYWVGEYQEVDSDNMETTGYQESSFYLSGFSRGPGAGLILENDKETLKKACMNYRRILASGAAIAISYDTGKMVSTNTADISRLDITLTIKEWRVNEND